MNENAKTIGFVGVAAVLLTAGVWLSWPAQSDDQGEIGQKFFPDFNVKIGEENKVDVVAGAEIVEVSPETSLRRAIKVERVDGDWKINPEKLGYPEVSVDRLADVVKSVRDLTKLQIASKAPDEHRRYGVIDPTDAESLKAGADGVGKLVTIQDPARSTLVKLIVGKKDEKKSGLSYVREPGRDVVYLTEIDPSPLSTRFEDWVKPDLLEEADGDLRTVGIDDHAIDAEKVREIQGIFAVERSVAKPIFKSEADLKKDGDTWTFARFETFDKEAEKFTPRKLADDEQIDSSKLFTLRGALGRIKIVDAVKKAPVLAEDLASASNFLTNSKSKVRTDEASIRDLRMHGFLPSLRAQGSQEIELINHEGDMTVGFADGVEFTLRFGDITGRGQSDAGKGADGEKEGDGAKPADAQAAAEGPASGSNTAPSRYLLVTAAFNADLIPKPKLEELPPEAGAAAPAKPEEKKPDEAKPAAVTEPAKPEPAKTEPAKPEPAKTDDSTSGSCDDQEPEKKEPEKKEPEKKDDSAKPADTKSAQPTASPTAKPAATATPTVTSTAAPTATSTATPTASPSATPAATPAAAKPTATPPATTTAAPAASPTATPTATATTPAATTPEPKKPMTPEERERITAANKRLQDTYDEQVKKGREKAERLNKKFAPWFYVVSASTYDDLNVDPTALVKKTAEQPPPGPPGGGMPPGGNFSPEMIQQMIRQQQQQQPPR